MRTTEIVDILTKCAKQYAPQALASLKRNAHMHALDVPADMPSQAQVDAVVVDLLNYVAISGGVDLALYTSDLRPAPAKEPSPVPTKKALAVALSIRYGGKSLEADDILDMMPIKGEELQFQASRNGYIDWYTVMVNSAGQPDATSITQLPF